MPVEIIQKNDCTGCGACWNICPKDCIDRKIDNQGFVYPKVNVNACINCEQCLKVCPLTIDKKSKADKNTVYAAWSKDEKIRFTSTSGGVFTEFAYGIINRNGIAVGAAYDSDNIVKHIIVSDKKSVELIRQSKYVQSDTHDIFREIESKLQQGTPVLFCGAPCQVAGLKTFLNKDYKELVTVDFICRGVNSPKAYSYWLDELQDIYKSKIVKVWFKYKIKGWKKSPFCTRVDFENGRVFVADANKNYFMRGYLMGNLYMRPSCSSCHFKGNERYSDITLADFWKISEELDDDKGTSMLMVNSDRGNNLLKEIEDNLHIFKKSFAEIAEGNGMFFNSVSLNPKGEEFLERLGDEKFSKLIKKYTKISWISRCKSMVKAFINKSFS